MFLGLFTLTHGQTTSIFSVYPEGDGYCSCGLVLHMNVGSMYMFFFLINYSKNTLILVNMGNKAYLTAITAYNFPI